MQILINSRCRRSNKRLSETVKLPRPLIVGVSGGADSTYLIHELIKSGSEGLIVCHVNHGLRGEDSDEDQIFVKRLTQDLGLVFESKALYLNKVLKVGDAFEAIARDERLKFFSEMAEKYQTPHVALAHHQNDQAETIIMNLCRGSLGVKAMSIRSEYNDLILWRPLLTVTKEEIVSRLVTMGVGWREDPTNAQPVARRNRIRNEVMPLLDEIFQRKTSTTISRAFSDDTAELLNEAISQMSTLDPQGRLFLPKLIPLSSSLRETVIHRYLLGAGIRNLTKAKIEECAKMCDISETAKVNLPEGRFFRRKEQRLFIDS